MHGVVNINKPSGWTSFETVRRVSKLSGSKAGHCGSLDPAATGVLLVLTGEACKASDLFMRSSKTYRAVLRLGYESSTLDSDGEISKKDVFHGSEEAVSEALKSFLGRYSHRVPALSAKKHRGRKFYEIARKGGEPPVRIQESVISGIRLLGYNPPDAHIEVGCTSGTYIRALAVDIAQKLGTCGYLKSLERTAVGSFGIKDSCGPFEDDWEKGFLEIGDALRFFPHAVLNRRASGHTANGGIFTIKDIEEHSGNLNGNVFVVFSREMIPVALAEGCGKVFRPKRVFNL